VDYQYMKALEYPITEGEKVKELGRVNFFLINQTNFFIKDFLKTNILDNCIFLLIVDLENHKTIHEVIQRWINFLEQELESYLRQIPLDDRKEVIEHFKIMNEKLRKLEYKGGSIGKY
jgi:hypothetical protein